MELLPRTTTSTSTVSLCPHLQCAPSHPAQKQTDNSRRDLVTSEDGGCCSVTPGHLVTTDPSTAPQPPPAEMCHHPRDQCDQVTSGRVSRVTCHVAGTLSPHCHRGPGARCDYITGMSHAVSHTPHITVTRHTGHTAAAGHTIVTLCHTIVTLTCWLHDGGQVLRGRGSRQD